MGRFGAIEIFNVEPFVMLRIDSGWPEKFVRIRLLNWEWKLEPQSSELPQPMIRQVGEAGFAVAFRERDGTNERISEEKKCEKLRSNPEFPLE